MRISICTQIIKLIITTNSKVDKIVKHEHKDLYILDLRLYF